jgi:heavy metal efflux system protein
MSGIVQWAASNRLIALLLAAGVFAAGLWAAGRIPIDAVPDVTNVQVQVVTRAPSLSATEVETQITQPIERTMAGLPGLSQIRSVSKFGISIVTLVFRDEIDTYFARGQVNERLLLVRDLIHPDVGRPELGPISTALGEIYMFELKPKDGTTRTAEDLRTMVEWQIAPRLRQVKGVVEVVGFGGVLRQFRVTLNPMRLAAHKLSVEDVRTALQRDNIVAGGGYIERAGEQVVLRGDARFRGIEDIAQTVVRADDRGIPIRVGMLGEVDTGPGLRQGAMTRDARGEIVGGSVLMLKGENSRSVVARVKQAIAAVQADVLPDDVIIDPYYDRAEFIDRVLGTVAKNLTEGAVLVVICLLLTLGSIRAGLLVAGAIPFSMLVGVLGLNAIGYSGNVMSLGSIDFGIVVEGAVVMVEHALTHMGTFTTRAARRQRLTHAMADVARPVVFGVVIVLLVFLPLGTLQDVEGKMFKPVVFSLCYMLAGALFYALVVVPALAPAVFGKVAPPKEPFIARMFRQAYEPTLDYALRRPWAVIGGTAALTIGMFAAGSTLGADFLPKIFEGALGIDVVRPVSVSLSQAVELTTETQRALKDVPEVRTIVDRIGRPEGAVDAAGPDISDMFIILKPRDEWRPGVGPHELVVEMGKLLQGRIPATMHSFSQPIEMRINDLVAGAKGDVVIKVFGEDLVTMSQAAAKLRNTLATIPGAADFRMEIATGLPSVKVDFSRERAARLGVSPRAVLDVLAMSRAGEQVGVVRDNERVFDLVLRLGGDTVKNERDLARLPVTTASGDLVPISMVADISQQETVVQVGREQMQRRLIVQGNVRGRDVVGFVNEARAAVAKIEMPRGIELKWGGQFENFNRAKAQLTILVPIAMAIIGLLLIMTFNSVPYTLVTLLNLPFALAGGIFALVLRGLPFSIPAAVGFIALCGVSVMNGVVMTTNLLHQPSSKDPKEQVRESALLSLRAIASTAIVAAIGFIPAAIATGTGSEVQRPLATVVIGGLIVAMLLSLPALPAMLYLTARRVQKQRPNDPAPAHPASEHEHKEDDVHAEHA